MVPAERLKDIVTQAAYSRAEKILIGLAVNPIGPKQPKELRDLLVGSGVRAASKWNVSALLANLGELVARTTDGWEITTAGHHRLAEVVGPYASTPVPRVASALRHHLSSLPDSDTRAFVAEAVQCFESRLYRAAIVLSWVGAVSVLYDHVVASHLAAFNAEASRRDNRWRNASGADGLSRMREYDFLQILASLSIIGRNTKQELEKRLNLRNACGHPNSLSLGENMVAAHVEALVLNVYSRF